MRRATLASSCLILLNQWFQSTLSVRRATVGKQVIRLLYSYFNPRSPWGERHLSQAQLIVSQRISIHALREESDCTPDAICYNLCWFQSTLSVRRATTQAMQEAVSSVISIHALREESDLIKGCQIAQWVQISIHALREESDCQRRIGLRLQRRFQSTLSVRRATFCCCELYR